MISDLKAYSLHIQMLEVINYIIYAIIIVVPTFIAFISTKKFSLALITFLISILVGYVIYSIIQLTADRHKLQIDIYTAITDKSNQL